MIKYDGCEHVEVIFFDGIYETVRSCYKYKVDNSNMFRIIDCCEGEQFVVTRGYKDHVSYYFSLDEAICIMAETGELSIDDVKWLRGVIK